MRAPGAYIRGLSPPKIKQDKPVKDTTSTTSKEQTVQSNKGPVQNNGALPQKLDFGNVSHGQMKQVVAEPTNKWRSNKQPPLKNAKRVRLGIKQHNLLRQRKRRVTANRLKDK